MGCDQKLYDRSWLLSVAAVVLPGEGAADAAMSPVNETYILDEIPVVLSASRLSQPLTNSPAAMTMIDRETIEASGAITIADVLRLVPGFQVSTLSGANMTAQYHGLADQNPKRMLVQIDGRSVYHSAFGGVHWDTLPFSLNDIERIEVLRGSNASTYGSNAFMGVVNIITRSASQDRGNQFSVMAGYGDTRQAEWRHGGNYGDFDYRLSISGFTTDGFPDYTDTHDFWDSTGVIPSGQVVNFTPFVGEIQQRKLERADDQTIGRFNFRGDHALNNGDKVLFELGYARNNRDNSLIKGAYDELRPDEELRSSFQLLKWSRQNPDAGGVSLQLSHNRLSFDGLHIDPYILRDSNFVYNLGPVLGGYRFDNDRYDLEFQQTLPRQDGWRIAWGAGIRLDQVDGENLFIDDEDYERWQYRLFANTEKEFGDDRAWVLNAGLMLEHDDDFGTNASPRVALNRHLDGHNTVRIAASRAYRMPSFVEQYVESDLSTLSPPAVLGVGPYDYTMYSNRGYEVDPEEMTSVEFGWINANAIEGLVFDARVFREELRNYIDSALHNDGCVMCDSAPAALGFSTHDIRVFENAGQMDIWGVDLQTHYKPNDRTTFIHTASYTRAKGSTQGERDASGNWIPGTADDMSVFVPKLTMSALLSHRFDHGWSGSAGYYMMSPMDWPNLGDALDRYDRWDLRLAKRLRMQRDQGLIELIVQNAFDDEYEEFRHQNMFERRIYLRLTMDFD